MAAVSLQGWLDYNGRKPAANPFDHPPVKGDVIEIDEILVTEEPLTEDTLRRFADAEARRPFELIKS